MKIGKWIWLGLVVVGAGCVQILDGAYDYEPLCGVDGPCYEGKACSVDANCDDGNPCTTEVCSVDTKICLYTRQADGAAPAAAQIAADCQAIACMDGQPVVQNDAADVRNDGNPCTEDLCVADKPINDVSPDGATCEQGSKTGTCQAGVCQVSCDGNNPCDDGIPCTDDFCNLATSMCVFTSLDGVPTPGAMELTGDCKLHICTNGMDTIINDDTDVFDDGNSCTLDVCTDGTPSNPPQDAGIPCMVGDPNVCDGNGACVECSEGAHCVNIIEDECTKRSCVANKCVPMYMGNETLASPALQTPGDCKKVVCNGAGGTTNVNDNADIPVDGNACTKDICTNGTPSNPNEAENTNCGNGLICNATGTCVGCNMASQCMGTDDFCKTRTCNNNQCGYSYTAAGTDLTMGQTAGDCKVLECDGAGNVVTSVLQSDVPVDGNPCTQDLCNAQGVPSNPSAAVNSPCNVNGNDACDGMGTCKKSLGNTCAAGSECVSTNCVDGVCCNNTCTTTCRSCNVAGSVGVCADVPKGTDDGACTGPAESCNVGADCDDENGQSCSGGNSCLSGYCVDGVCCNSTCSGLCQACSNAKTGAASGLCGPVTVGTDPDNECSTQTQSTCGRTGFCGTGGACQLYAASIECAPVSCTNGILANVDTCNGTGTCVDGGTVSCSPYICNSMTACKTSCASDSDCVSTHYCSSMACIPRKASGQVCAAANECSSGHCVDNRCCDTACTDVCKSCANAMGICTNLPLYTDDFNPSCTVTNTCNGAGACLKKNSEPCSINSECASNKCSGTCKP